MKSHVSWNGTRDIECLWLKLSLLKTHPTYICSLYILPDGQVDNALAILKIKAIDLYADGNLDLILWGMPILISSNLGTQNVKKNY